MKDAKQGAQQGQQQQGRQNQGDMDGKHATGAEPIEADSKMKDDRGSENETEPDARRM